MKKIVLTAALFAITSLASVQAQNIPQRSNNDNKKWDNSLNLTDAQKQQMKDLQEDGQKQMEAIRNDNTLTQEQKKEKVIAFQKEQRAKRQALLTPEQKAKAETFAKQGNRRDMKMNNRKFNHSSGRGTGFGRNNSQKGYNNLNLTDAQKQQMKALQEDGQKQMNVIKNDNKLTAEQKKEKMQTLQQSQRTKRQAILTPEQRAKVENFSKQGRQRGMGMNHYRQFNKFGNNKNGFAARGFHNSWNDLNLTDIQKEQMKTLQEDHQKQMNDLRQQQKTKMMSILTPEQKAKWEERNNNMHKNFNRDNSK
ncbi:MAG TPA: hypothetical protein PK110_09445 [Niabella sp.]|jgi:protein CpxP|nr:hypothetical protein [Niabella sp.]HRO85032.1 hypothetical protein [Niabella sp.]HUN03963.1 hypothetical protein [Niabella sp.]